MADEKAEVVKPTFDKTAFLKTEFEPRTLAIDIISPALKQFFKLPEGEEISKSLPQWTVRGLTYPEVSACLDAPRVNKAKDIYAQGLSSTKEQVDAIKREIGIGTDTNDDSLVRLEQLVIGSVEPAMSMHEAVLFADRCSGDFRHITDTIVQLSALGMDIKKPSASGQTNPSET